MSTTFTEKRIKKKRPGSDPGIEKGMSDEYPWRNPVNTILGYSLLS
jgi:hypothetical protein